MSTNNCTDCYNGCTEITSDKCVKYTGIDVPALGIKKGDSLTIIEQSLIGFLVSTLDGTGILPIINNADICTAVSNNLPTCSDYSLNNYLTALIKTSCDLQDQIDNLTPTSTPSYDVKCLTGVTSTSTTPEVLQVVITKLCALQVQVDALALDLSTNYVLISDIDTYIQNYLNTGSTQTLVSNKMVPFSAVPYFGSLTNFDSGGAGIGDWDKIYLCNGENGTPDLRGRVIVGSTSNMGGSTMSSIVNPSISGNPAYDFGTTHGTNQVTLGVTQIPAHTHANTVSSTITPSSHNHGWTGQNGTGWPDGADDNIAAGSNHSYPTETQEKNVTLTVNTTITNASAGGSLPHSNYQPGLSAYYIIYIP